MPTGSTPPRDAFPRMEKFAVSVRKVLLGLMSAVGLLSALVLYEQLFFEKAFGPSAILLIAALSLLFLCLALTYRLSATRHRELVAKLWLAAIAVVVSYFALDLAAGFLLIRPLSPPLVPDEYRHHKLLPNSYAKLEQRDFSYVQRVNNVGIRGRDVSPVKPPGVYRILMLGDSFTMAKGVEDHQTFSVLLEEALNRRARGCDRKFEVLNGGVDSYAPVLSLIHLKRELHTLSPDLMMLNFDMSDLVQETAYRLEAVYEADGEVIAVRGKRKLSLSEVVRNWVDRHLFFTRAALFYANRLAGHRGVTVRNVATQADLEVVAHTLASDTVDRREQWEKVFESIKRIKGFADEHDIDFLLTVYPWAHQISNTEWRPGRNAFMPPDAVASDTSVRTLKDFARKASIEVIDTYPQFRQYRSTAPLYFRHDMHWTPAGNEVMARALEGHLTERLARLGCK